MYENKPQVITASEVAVILDALNDAMSYRNIPAPDGTVPKVEQEVIGKYQRLARRLSRAVPLQRNWAGDSGEWRLVPERRVFIYKDGEWDYLGELGSVDFNKITPPYKITIGRDIGEIQ